MLIHSHCSQQVFGIIFYRRVLFLFFCYYYFFFYSPTVLLNHPPLLARLSGEAGTKAEGLKLNQGKSSENLPLSPGVFMAPHFGYVAARAKSCYNSGRVSQKLERGKKSLSVPRPPSPRFSAPTVESRRRRDASKNFS